MNVKMNVCLYMGISAQPKKAECKLTTHFPNQHTITYEYITGFNTGNRPQTKRPASRP